MKLSILIKIKLLVVIQVQNRYVYVFCNMFLKKRVLVSVFKALFGRTDSFKTMRLLHLKNPCHVGMFSFGGRTGL